MGGKDWDQLPAFLKANTGENASTVLGSMFMRGPFLIG